jgi:hypothetical protein
LGGLSGRDEAPAAGGDAAILIPALAALACAGAVYAWFRRRAGGTGLLFGGLLWWLVLLLLASAFWPGASYLFAWPPVPGLLALALVFGAKDKDAALTGWRLPLLALGALAGVALFAPVVYLTLIAFGSDSASAAFVVAAPVALVLALLVPFFPPVGEARERRALS